jgi:hypothetical protein
MRMLNKIMADFSNTNLCTRCFCRSFMGRDILLYAILFDILEESWELVLQLLDVHGIQANGDIDDVEQDRFLLM